VTIAEADASSRRQSAEAAFALIARWAADIESERSRIDEWYRCEPIRELGGMTAQQLVMQGDADLVIGFLQAIRRGDRG